ncbi:MAG: sulfatase [Phycisphaeraceae bacterium]
MSKQMNLLVILIDQQHWNMMSCAGNPHVHTPNMDRLAQEGVRFTRTYAANPVCIPSRFSLMTGRMPTAIGMRSNADNSAEPLPQDIERNALGHLARRAGYRPLYGGKQHIPRSSAEKMGFEYFCVDERDALADACAKRLSRGEDEPFLMVASFINPHDICYMAIRESAETPEERDLIERGGIELATLEHDMRMPEGVDEERFFAELCPPLPDNFEPQEGEPEAIANLLAKRPFRKKAREDWDERPWRMHRWAYAKLTERVDREIGKVLDALDHGPHADNTVLVFTSDHGDMDASHRMEHKTAFYDEAARVPLIVRRPGETHPGRVDHTHLISNGLDFVPTFCDYMGIEPPADLEGQSFRPRVETGRPAGQLANPSNSSRPWIKIENEIGRCVVSATHKYARYDEGERAEQFVDLVNDPGEMRNAVDNPEQADALRQHRAWYDQAFPDVH